MQTLICLRLEILTYSGNYVHLNLTENDFFRILITFFLYYFRNFTSFPPFSHNLSLAFICPCYILCYRTVTTESNRLTTYFFIPQIAVSCFFCLSDSFMCSHKMPGNNNYLHGTAVSYKIVTFIPGTESAQTPNWLYGNTEYHLSLMLSVTD